MIKYLIIFTALFVAGCSSFGIKAMKKSELSGKVAPTLVKNDIVIVSPKKTNSYIFEVINEKPTIVAYTETKSPKQEAQKNEKRVIFDIITEPSTNVIKIEEPKSKTITTNFLIFWYGTLILAIVAYFLLKLGKRKNSKIVDLSSDI